MRPVRLGQGSLGIDPMFEGLCHPGELAGIHGLRQPQQAALGLLHCLGADMLRGPGHDGDVLIRKVATGKRLLRLRQVLQLAGDADPLGRGATREFAPGAEPRHQVNRPVGRVLAGLIEAPQALGEDRLQAVLGLPCVDEPLAKRGALRRPHGGRVVINRCHQSGPAGLYPIACRGHARIMRDGFDSCLSQRRNHPAVHGPRKRPARHQVVQGWP